MLFALAPPAQAEDLCTDRGGLSTDPCTLGAEQAMVEIGVADWSRDMKGAMRADAWAVGDIGVRYGVGGGVELQGGWTALGGYAERDRLTGAKAHGDGVGDVRVAAKWANGAIGVQGYAVLPTGGGAAGQGAWSAGMLVPASFDLSETLAIGLTGEIDAAANASRHGRHLAFSGIAELDFAPADGFDLLLGIELGRDDDPSGATTQASFGASAVWRAGKRLQLDMGAVAGLNRDTPDIELLLGFSRQF